MEIKRLLNDVTNQIELEWLDTNLVRIGGELTVSIVEKDENFNPLQYRGDFAIDRIEQIKIGGQRTMKSQEFARACATQQMLELMFMLFLKYGDNFPYEATFDLGISQSRIVHSKYGYYYGEWLQIVRERKLRLGLAEDLAKAQLEYEMQKQRVLAAEESRVILGKFRDHYVSVEPAIVDWSPAAPTCVAVKCLDDVTVGMAPISRPYANGDYDSEGVLVSWEPTDIAKIDDDNIVVFAGCQKSMMNRQEKMHFDKSQLGLSGQVEYLTKINDLEFADWIGAAHPMGWNLTSEQWSRLRALVELNDMQIKNGNQSILTDNSRALQILSIEAMNEREAVNNSFHHKDIPLRRYKFSWDLHSFGPLTHRNVAFAAEWDSTNCDQVKRVIVLNCRGNVLIDYTLMQGKEYQASLFTARRLAYMAMAGANIFGFNIYQHLSTIGFVGTCHRVVDMTLLPCLKGAKASLSIEKYRARYGITIHDATYRMNPMMDNLEFCVYLMRRDGINWRRRRKM